MDRGFTYVQSLLVEGSDHYDVFSEAERSEFIFRLFKHLQLGGRVNQVCTPIAPPPEAVPLYGGGRTRLGLLTLSHVLV